MNNKNILAHLLAIITIFIWGTTFISTKILLTILSPVEILAFRFFTAFLILIFIYPKKFKLLHIKEEILFDMDTAVPLGIIINELVSNSLKHAFRGREKGKIQIKLHYDKNVEINSNGYKRTSYILSISDNGIGINENLDIEDLDSLGLQLVTSLVDQLDGELELIRNNGTEFIIKFTLIQETNQTSSKVTQLIF
jgi:signal transduction histidine kinase